MRRFLLIVTGLAVFVMIHCGETSSMKLEKTVYSPGEEIKVSFTAPASFESDAWIGIIPSDVPHGSESTNDEHDLDYEYLDKKASGTITFTAPGKAGSYDFRMHDTDGDGKEVTHISFQVKVNKEGTELKLEKTIFAPGEEIKVLFATPAGYAPDAWVGIVPSQIAHGDETENDQHDLDYQYLEKRTSGTLIFDAPDDPGSYDFRMHDTDDDGNEIIHVTFEVKGE